MDTAAPVFVAVKLSAVATLLFNSAAENCNLITGEYDTPYTVGLLSIEILFSKAALSVSGCGTTTGGAVLPLPDFLHDKKHK